ncbi:hypothetical protein M9978_08350 [Sphingomonas sp. MG17]|uniref:Uncharacterized protein n=1 Tax=Sphingomonas tagetis TaxID=2949092 RepID=A0A9X2KP99_9SPHN|nr:hypothetical protein [Sphingomonas tagetis]MCP3730438.1 hypothetical protein [Sphingomonas tagetis]
MAFVTPAQSSFNGGEQSPRILSRIDQSVRSIAVKSMSGWLPLLSGVAEACPGTIFVAKAKGPCRLIPFEFQRTQGYQIELGHLYARFYTNDAQIMDGDDPVEIVTPWTLAQARELYYHQSLDVLYCAHREVPLHVIKRIGADEFVCEPYALQNGPLDLRNADRAVTVSASATTGTVTVTASSALFAAGDVGGIMEIESPAFGTIPAWEAGMSTAGGAFCQSNGNVYENTGGATRTGTVAPIHVEGTEYDGMGGTDVNSKGPYGAAWTFVHSMFGLVEFTGYVSATEMEATVLQTLPSTAASWRWSFGAFSDRRGHPGVVGVWQERLILCKDHVAYGSVAGALDDFAPRNELGDISRDQAFRYPLPSGETIMWVLDDLQLVAGTDKAEHVIFAASAGQGAGPGNLDRSVPADNGSRAARPVKIGGRAIHIDASCEKAIQLAYDSNRLLRAESPDLTRFAEHIGEGDYELVEMAWLKLPQRHLWFRCENGTLAVMGYEPDEQFIGWAPRTLGGGMLASSISTNTDPTGKHAQLWMSAEADEEVWVLRMPRVRRVRDSGEQVMTDAAVRRTGAASALVSAPHLAGRTVDICADGRPLLNAVLDGDGEYMMPFEAEDVIVGLTVPNELEFVPPVGGSDNGPALGKQKRAHRIDLHVLNSDELEVECQGSIDRINLLRQERAFDVSMPLFSGRQRIEPAGDYDGDMAIKVRRIYPRPSTLAIVMPFYESAQA